jgi:hypothetical protein
MSDKVKAQGPFVIGGCLLAVAGHIMLLVAKKPAIRCGHPFLVACAVYPGSPIVMGWLSHNLALHYVRATGISFQIAIANCAAFAATFAYLTKDA